MMNGEVSKYTVSVYELIENGFDFGLQNYEIFNEDYRPVLNKAILEYYKFREIGYVNPAIWRDRLNQRMDLIMRNKYNALYKAKMTDFNPLFNVDLTETFTHEISNTGEENNNNQTNFNTTSKTNSSQSSDSKSTTDNKNNNLNLSSQFPSEEMTEGDLTDNVFVDSAQKGNNTTNEKTTSEDNTETTEKNEGSETTINKGINTTSNKSIETYTRRNVGSSAGLPFSKALIQLKEFYDKYQLDKQVIDELKDLFIQIW